MESILTSIKKMLGPSAEYDHFDPDIIMHINTVLMILSQLGIGKEGFIIEDDTATWADYLVDPTDMPMVKSYIYIKVRLVFDPPANATVIKALTDAAAEYEWRMHIDVETNPDNK